MTAALRATSATGGNVVCKVQAPSKRSPAARFVDAGDVITSAGISAGIDMALHLIARLESKARAREVRHYIQYDLQPPV
jgi:transcriptional regulator GlxA family with amidase domain